MFSLCSCGSNPSTTPTSTSKEPTYKKAYICKEKDNSDICIAYNYVLDPSQTSISAYKLYEDGDLQYCNYNPKDNMYVIVKANQGYAFDTATCSIGTVNLNKQEYISNKLHYAVFTVSDVPTESFTFTLNYTLKVGTYNITLTQFNVPSPSTTLDNLKWSARLNGEEITYNQSSVISTANLYNALDSKATNHVLSVNSKEGLYLKAYMEDGFMSSKFNRTGGNWPFCKYESNYKEYYTFYNFIPVEDGSLYLDFASIANNDYSNYTLVSTAGGTTSIGKPSIYLDNVLQSKETISLSDLKNKTSIELLYPKSAFEGTSIDYTKLTWLKAGGESFFEESNRVVVDKTNENVKVIIKGEGFDTIYPFESYLRGADKDGFNIIKNDIYNFEISLKLG